MSLLFSLVMFTKTVAHDVRRFFISKPGGRPCEFGIFGKTSNFEHFEFCLKRVICERRFIEDGELCVVLAYAHPSTSPHSRVSGWRETSMTPRTYSISKNWKRFKRSLKINILILSEKGGSNACCTNKRALKSLLHFQPFKTYAALQIIYSNLCAGGLQLFIFCS